MIRLSRSFLLALGIVALFSACGEKEKSAAGPPKEVSYSKLIYESLGTDAIFLDPDTNKGFTGIARDHDKKGALISEFPFKDGRFHGLVKEWYPSGKPKSETEFAAGLRSGRNIEWTEDGAVFSERVYDKDKIVSEKKPTSP